MEVYTPYYLFRGDRPRIDAVPNNISYDEPFEVGYGGKGPIGSVALVRPGATTHAFDMDQRYINLRFTREGADRLTVVGPRDEHVAPPGYYMLFLLNDERVPSEAKFIHLPVPSDT